MSGQEIGQLMAQALEGGAIEKPPWYEPFNGAQKESAIKSSPQMEFDSLVVDAPSPKVNRPGRECGSTIALILRARNVNEAAKNIVMMDK